MADTPTYRDPNGNNGDDPAAGPNGGSTIGMPRWVKVSLFIAVVLVLAFVILKLTGTGGEHGPGRHGGGGVGQTPSSSVTGHRPPAGVHGG